MPEDDTEIAACATVCGLTTAQVELGFAWGFSRPDLRYSGRRSGLKRPYPACTGVRWHRTKRSLWSATANLVRM